MISDSSVHLCAPVNKHVNTPHHAIFCLFNYFRTSHGISQGLTVSPLGYLLKITQSLARRDHEHLVTALIHTLAAFL